MNLFNVFLLVSKQEAIRPMYHLQIDAIYQNVFNYNDLHIWYQITQRRKLVKIGEGSKSLVVLRTGSCL